MIDMNKNKTKASESGAKKFLCIILALMIIFVGVVCVSVHERNKDILANSEPEKSPANSTENALSSTKPENTVASGSTTQNETEAATVGVTAALPGTIKNPTIITIDEDNWHLTLVNSGYRIPSDYNPDLVYVCGSGERLDKNVAVHYEKMYKAAAADGVDLAPCSGYRSYETQERNYNNKIAFFESQGYETEEAKVKAATIIMPPGSSEHNLGYAMDIVCVDEWFEDTEEFKWLQKNAADYGFIMRYPKDKQDITKVIYEPWHWRYVGVEAAKEMKASGQVLEEYLGVAQ